MNMKIGFIGTGNMGGAIIDGMLEKHRDDIVVSSHKFEDTLKYASERGILAAEDNNDLAKQVGIVLLAVKPNVLSTVFSEIRDTLAVRKPLIISIAAGNTLKDLSDLAQIDGLPIVRVMPNVNAQVESGVAGIVGNEFVTSEQLDIVKEIFQSIGVVYEIPEKDFSTFTAISGSSPAYVYMFIDAISRAAVKHGMQKKLATEIAAQAVLGSAKMLSESELDPWSLVDMVSSPGGTTVAGVVALEDAGFISDVIKGIDATIARDQEM
jgi:pyrroline-5-carboxylate reductase